MDSTQTVHDELPTIEEAREFLVLVNKGRAAVGLEPLGALDFDGAQPGSLTNCLSARNLFVAVCKDVGYVTHETAVSSEPLMVAIGAVRDYDVHDMGTHWRIPEPIVRVTRPFDGRVPGLRERLVEAGVVAP